MEPGIFGQLKRYFQAGGNPEQVIEQLSINYNAVAQMANLLAEWLILGGMQRFYNLHSLDIFTISWYKLLFTSVSNKLHHLL